MKKKCTFPATLCVLCLMAFGGEAAFGQNPTPGQNGTSGQNAPPRQNKTSGQNANGQNTRSGQNAALAQGDPIEFKPDPSGVSFSGGPSAWQSHIVANDNHQAMITFADKKDVFYYLVDASFGVISQYTESKDSLPFNYFKDKYEVVLQSGTGHAFNTYIHKRNSAEIYAQTPDFTNGVSVFRKFLDIGNKEKLLTAFEAGGHVYFVTHPKNGAELRFYIDSIATPKRIALHLQDSTLDLEGELKNIKVIKESREPDLLTVQNKAKLYIRPGRPFVLTLDNSYQHTILWSFELTDTSSEAKVFRKNPVNCNYVANESALESNSYVYQDKILQALFCSRDLLMQLKDIATDSVIAEYHATRDSAILFSSSGLITKEEGKTTSVSIFGSKTKNTGELSTKDLRTKDLFKAINRSDLAMVIVPEEDYLIIKTGEAHHVSSGGGGGAGMYMGRGVAGGAGGMIGMATYGGLSMGNYPSKEGQSETYIMTVLKRDNLEFVPDMPIQTKYDKLDVAADLLKDVRAAETNFDMDGKTYYFYWDKKAKKLMIQQVI